jgi:hypothetical protein
MAGGLPDRVIEDLLPTPPGHKIAAADFKPAVKWIQRITFLLQKAQLYSARRVELLSKESRARRERFLTLRRCWKRKRTQTLYEAWKLPYFRPIVPRRCFTSPTPAPASTQPSAQQIWIQYSRSVARVDTPAPRARKTSRPQKLKLRRLRNILLLCR